MCKFPSNHQCSYGIFGEITAVRDINNVTSLRKIYDRVESSIRNLKSVGINPNSYDSLLTTLLNEKLLS